MNNEKMAKFIFELRKSQRLTQKQLAEKLSVTDKAVSKWERGLSCPDISLLSDLSMILGVTTTELLNGERGKVDNKDLDKVVVKTLEYATNSNKSKSRRIRGIVGFTINVIFLLGIIVCTICNVAINGKLTWALYPISSILFAWIVLLPIIKKGVKGILLTNIVISIFVIPYLYVLNGLIDSSKLMMPIGIRVSIVGIVYLWIAYFVFKLLSSKALVASGIISLLAIPASVVINMLISKYVNEAYIDGWDVFTYAIILLFAGILFATNNFLIQRKDD